MPAGWDELVKHQSATASRSRLLRVLLFRSRRPRRAHRMIDPTAAVISASTVAAVVAGLMLAWITGYGVGQAVKWVNRLKDVA